MNKIIIRNRFDDSVIFKHECENNTTKITVEKAVKEKVSLRSANLSSANLSSADNKNNAFLPIYCKWSHSIIGDKIQIGCKVKTVDEWVKFFENSQEIYSTKRNTEEFKQIKAVFYSYKAYLEILNS